MIALTSGWYGSRMRIGVVTTWYPSRTSPGAGSYVARDVAALAVDHDVKVLHLVSRALDDGERTFWDGAVEVTRVPADVRTLPGWWAARGAAKEFLAETDVLHTMAAPALLPWILTRPGLPWVHTEHWSGVANIAGPGRARLLRGVGRRLLGRPDVVAAVSGFLARAVGTMRRSRTVVIGNIVDPAPVAAGLVPRASQVRDGLTLVAVGTLNAHKGWGILLAAVRLLRAEGTDARAVWIGDGPDREAFAAAVHEAALADVVRLTGHLPAAQVHAELARADVFVLPTRLETFSLATVEALVAGCPVVVTGVGGQVDMVTPLVGRVVERTPEAVAAGVRTVAQSCTREDALARGRELADGFSEERYRASYAALYAEVARG